MASISCSALAEELLACCLADQPWPASLVARLIESDCAGELFRIVIERLGDLFEPRLCLVYARLFSQIIAQADLPYEAAELYERYLRIRETHPWDGPEPNDVCVLSRVTLGADIVVTSVFLEAARQRFPNARVWFMGSSKSAQLFAADPRIGHIAVDYPRGGSLIERLASAARLPAAIPNGALILDPDSRFTQLGLLPICREENYRFFESRSYGGDGDDTVGALSRRWCEAVLGVSVKDVALAPESVPLDAPLPCAAVSLGVGANAAKRLGAEFEAALLGLLAKRFRSILIDRGAGGDEAQRVDTAIAASRVNPARFIVWDGSFAGFVSLLSQAQFYVGYDSAGQHAAAACGIPLLTIFAGYASHRMLARWTPAGREAVSIITLQTGEAVEGVLDKVSTVLKKL